MIDSGTKHPENRIHLYDPVGLLHEGYGAFRPSSHGVRPRRQTVSYDNFVETTNSNSPSGIGSYDSFTDANSTGGLRSYDSFEVDSLGLRSYNESFNLEATDDRVNSYDSSTNTTAADHQDRNDGGLRFITVNNVVEDDKSDDSTPRLWRPSSPKSPKSLRSPLHHTTTATSANSSSLYPSSPPKSSSAVNSPPLNPSSPKSVKFAPLNPTSVKSAVNSPPNPTSLNQQQYQMMSPSSRTQAIAKGRKELMDMVRDLPESYYELSLRDIVDQKPELQMQKEKEKEIQIPEEKKPNKETTKAKETKKQKKSSSKKVKKSESKKKMVRSRSVDNGKFLLKTSVFPILGTRKSKKNLTAASSFKVAPMPKADSSSAGPGKVGEKDWWKRKSCISSESENSNGLNSHSISSRSSSSSSRSNSSNGRRSNRFLLSCCIFNGRRIGGHK
ncbi:uncharacterized protein LOC110685906 [Chenopodium quinoa]|uniref:uncharacterized protein LOC110685906 n=1 Tax=Chenopodium quinoa TaxID=63459 RepID=UPI000B77F1C3|nr:uncharacterized protein LOC110685906 [Chenopodium quinoa]